MCKVFLVCVLRAVFRGYVVVIFVVRVSRFSNKGNDNVKEKEKESVEQRVQRIRDTQKMNV